jgi:hypothetical protein
MTDLTTPRAIERPAPEPELVLPEQRTAGTAPRPPRGIVELPRMLGLVRLTAPQAAEVGAGLLAAVAGRAVDGPAPDRIHPVLTADGRVVLDPDATGAGVPLGAVLADVVAAAGRPGAGASPRDETLRAELDRALAALGTESTAATAGRLRLAVSGIDRLRVRGELAALARTVRGLPAGAGPAAGVRAVPAALRPRSEPRRPKRRRSAGRRIGAWLLSFAVLGAVVAAEIVWLGDDITKDIDLLLDAGRGGEEPADEPEPDGLPVPVPAPASAGPVAGVDLRPLASCSPGAPCSVRLLVRLVPSPEPQVVAWSYRVVDRCTGATTTVPGGSVTMPPLAERAEVVGDVALPPLAGVALLAVTDVPAVAASGPVSAGSCRPAGPGA